MCMSLLRAGEETVYPVCAAIVDIEELWLSSYNTINKPLSLGESSRKHFEGVRL